MTEIIIDCGRLFRTVAWLNQGRTTRLRFFENEDLSVQGTVYLGRVVGLANSLDSAFVEIGLEKPGFLHFKDFPGKGSKEVGTQTKLKVGDSIVVQVVKEAVGEKGAKLTGFVNVRGLRGVLLPFEKGVFVSKEITSKAERLRLKKMAESLLPKGFGLVIRTLSEGMTEEAFKGVVESLLMAWETMNKTVTWAYPPKVLHKNSWTDALLESLLKGDIDSITVNQEELCVGLQKRLSKMDRERIILEVKHPDLLAERGVRTTMESLLNGHLHLPSGGDVTIDLTEAMTVYDVNSGAMISEGGLSATARKLNSEAVIAVLDHMTLADIGGMVVVDLVNMPALKDREAVVALAQAEAAIKDEGIQVHGLTKLGLLEMTRTREGESFYGIVSTACGQCGGMGRVKKNDWLFNEFMGRLDYYLHQGFAYFQIATYGPGAPKVLKEALQQAGVETGFEVVWEEHLGEEKFTYKIRPFRSKIS